MTDVDDLVGRPWRYLSILKGRVAEYEALHEMNPKVRSVVTALIALREGTMADNAPRDLAQALRSARTGFGRHGPVILDGQRLASPASFGLCLEAALGNDWIAIPAMRLADSAAYRQVVREAAAGGIGVVVRLMREDFAADDLQSRLVGLLSELSLEPERVDIVIDLRSIEWMKLGADELAVVNILAALPFVSRWRNLALASSGMPAWMTDFESNDIGHIPRTELWLYQALFERRHQLPRLPIFSDYAIAHPDPVEDVNAKFIPQIPSLRYTTDAEWLMVKGFDVNREGPEHFPPLLTRLTKDPDFSGHTFSAGDKWIADAAAGKTTIGNATVRRRAATSHHLTLVTQQIASRFAA